MRVIWSPPAEADLDELVQYIASDSVNAALAQDLRIRQAVSRLETHPRMGRPGLVDGTRELVITGTPYVAHYRLREDRCEILSIVHGARDWPPAA